MNIRCFLAVVFGLTLPVAIVAQPSEPNKQASKTVAANSKVAKDPEAERVMKERRENAQSLLLNLAAEAGRFNDQTLRARTQARIADVLWSADPERASVLFRKAWESAEIVDQEGQRKLQEEMQRQQTGGVLTSPPNIRAEVLRLAAKHDRALGEELLAKLRTQQQQDATNNADRARNNPLENQTPEAISQRLSLARQLLDTDVARAIQFADPALTTLSREGLDFLSYLREKDATAADMRYAALLARAAGDVASDANTVSMLSSYLFTPHTYISFSDRGSSTMSSGRATPPPDAPAQLRNTFFRVAGDILLRPLAQPGQDQSSSGVQGKYLMLKRLGPLFDQYAPKELAQAIHAQENALAQGLPEDVRQRDDDTLREGIRDPQTPADREKALQDRIDRAKTAEERDNLYVAMARLYVDKGDLRARDYVDKIEDTEMRNKVRPYIDVTFVLRAIDKKDTDLLFELIRKADLSHSHRAYALAQAAKLLAKTDRDRSMTTIDEAATEAKRIDETDADRPRALLGVANAWLTLDRAKTWDAVYEAVKAANAAEGFTGEDGVIKISLVTKGGSSARSSTVADFNVSPIFTELAKEDYNRSVELIRSFEREAPRASATIAIARTVLEDKKN